MTLSEVLLLLTLVFSVAYGVFDITWKISHDDKDHKKQKRLTATYFSKYAGQSFLLAYGKELAVFGAAPFVFLVYAF